MTKTNLERIRERFLARFPLDEEVEKGEKKWGEYPLKSYFEAILNFTENEIELSLQQRMDEIEGEVKRKIHNVEITELETKEAELTKVAVIEAFKEVLNIIKSVDKNNVDTN